MPHLVLRLALTSARMQPAVPDREPAYHSPQNTQTGGPSGEMKICSERALPRSFAKANSGMIPNAQPSRAAGAGDDLKTGETASRFTAL
jgi:hypothetical protein